MAVPCPSLCQIPEEADVHSSPDLRTLARATLWVTLTVCHTLSHLSVAGEQGHELSGEGGLGWNSVLITLLRIVIKYLTKQPERGRNPFGSWSEGGQTTLVGKALASGSRER